MGCKSWLQKILLVFWVIFPKRTFSQIFRNHLFYFKLRSSNLPLCKGKTIRMGRSTTRNFWDDLREQFAVIISLYLYSSVLVLKMPISWTRKYVVKARSDLQESYWKTALSLIFKVNGIDYLQKFVMNIKCQNRWQKSKWHFQHCGLCNSSIVDEPMNCVLVFIVEIGC